MFDKYDKKRKGRSHNPKPPPTVGKAYKGPEYGFYYLISNVYTGYWPCELVENEEQDGQLTGRLMVWFCHPLYGASVAHSLLCQGYGAFYTRIPYPLCPLWYKCRLLTQ